MAVEKFDPHLSETNAAIDLQRRAQVIERRPIVPENPNVRKYNDEFPEAPAVEILSDTLVLCAEPFFRTQSGFLLYRIALVGDSEKRPVICRTIEVVFSIVMSSIVSIGH